MQKGNKKSSIATTATGALKILWKKGFFKTKKKQINTAEYFGRTGYNFSDAELGMALGRAKKYLTRKGKRGGYEYIQKYPFIEDEK